MDETKKVVLRDNLSWMNSEVGLKSLQQLFDEYPIYKGQSLIIGVFHMEEYKQNTSKKILRSIGQLLQECYGLDYVYYLEDGYFLAALRVFQKNMFLSYARYVIDSLKDKEDLHLHLSYITGCVVNETILKMMYHTARQEVSSDQEIVGTRLIDRITLTKDFVDYLYQTDHCDELTGLLEKKDFLTYGVKAIKDAIAADQQADIHVIYFNIVNFKLFNDRYGYGEGNVLLKNFANLLRRRFPGYLISRFESDHFYIIYDKPEIKETVKEIQKELPDLSRNVYLEARAGVAKVDAGKEDMLETYCDYAKMSVDMVKKSQKSIGFYVDAYKQQEILKNYIVENFKQAIEKEWIKLYFQPVVRTLNHQLCSMEVLSRWQDPVYGLLAPDMFISTLEDYQLIYYLDTYVIKNVCRIFRENKKQGRPVFPVSFNLSRLDLEKDDGAIFDFIEETAEQYHVPKAYLNIEITESTIAHNPDFIKSMIEKFHRAGYLVWMDDFGSEYSSLNTLKEFNFDELKIDMKFLRGFNEKSRRIVTSIVEMAKELNIQTLAEGVETAEQYDFLSEIGCEKVQGYLFSKPLPLNDVLEVLKAEHVSIEDIAYASYYDDIGHVNLLSSHPLSNRGANYESDIALAVIEYRDDHLHYLTANAAYMRMLKSLEIHSLAESEVVINDPQWDVNAHMIATAKKMLTDDSQDDAYFDFFDRDNYCIVAARKVAMYGNSLACLIQLDNISKNSAFVHDQSMKRNASHVYSLFDQVYIFDLDEGSSTLLYAHNHRQYENEQGKIIDWIRDMAEHYVYAQDRHRFLKFFDLKSFNERLNDNHYGHLNTLVRMILGDGHYQWCLFEAKNIIRAPSRQVIVTICPFDMQGLASFLQTGDYLNASPDQTIDAKLLWNSMMNADLGLFWKDQEGRYQGVNDIFVTYFDLQEAHQVIGKTDKEMGWFINTESLKEEQNVIDQGKRIKNLIRQVIVNGQIRRIIVSEQPIYDGSGKIIGALGYFNDIEEDRTAKQRLIDLKNIDEATDTLNEEGFRETITNYVESYEFRKMDFCLVMFSLDNLKEFSDVYGYKMGEEMIDLVANILKEMFGFNSVIAHPQLSVFLVLHQVQDRQRFAQDVDTALRHVKAISSIGGIRYNIYISHSMTYYSEVGDLGKLQYLAKARLESKTYDAPNLIASDIPQYTTREIIEVMKKYTPLFDLVRLIEPDRSRVTMLDEKGNLSVQPYCCYHVLGRTQRCKNCISRHTLQTRKNYTKIERAPEGQYFAMSRFVVVDGKEFSLEFIKKIDETPDDQ